MSSFPRDQVISEIEKTLNYVFKNKNMLIEAITHKSYFAEMGRFSKGYNERLEYLGDTVVNLLISDMLFHCFPYEEEGPLSQRRAALVSEESLSAVAIELKMDQWLLLGKGEKLLSMGKKNRILACLFEAIIGAVYLDGGFEAAREIMIQQFQLKVSHQGDQKVYRRDFKTVLQEVIQKKSMSTPIYQLEKEDGPAHDKFFIMSVRYNEIVLGVGEGKTKKQAEQEAARKALEAKLYDI